MAQRLPSLTLLTTFEAAARHLSFKQAAEEICITPAAVSQHIKALEAQLGVTLFHRRVRGLDLTPQGAALLPELRAALDQLAAAVAGVRQATHGPLAITAPPSFASHWLLPRLPRFVRAHPDLPVRLTSTSDTVGRKGAQSLSARLHPARQEVAILYGRGHYPGYITVPIFTPDYVPVCAPALVDGLPTPLAPAELARLPLIHDDTFDDGKGAPSSCDWHAWLERAGLPPTAPLRGPRFSNTVLALEAALAGHGVALAPRPLVEALVAAGKLVIPCNLALPSPSTYSLVMREAVAQHPAALAFRDWIIAEANIPAGHTTR
ncbi:LysR substrate-binding domain-containing protein [Pseudothauera rhizosphaerae]|uniref:LysR family transcriptional regulator n=1 Tax=Pseudothauera rhizosphaerae TaxID=2565932 RepID=A0A4S4ACX1_9RHOO|nr:LysR substrate-binding domain-containing protein [Pseudothauera rhizosphaerae]THF56533.1 LysR family transcriptional regulator [Pseudothauera rhizosphaerae]